MKLALATSAIFAATTVLAVPVTVISSSTGNTTTKPHFLTLLARKHCSADLVDMHPMKSWACCISHPVRCTKELKETTWLDGSEEAAARPEVIQVHTPYEPDRGPKQPVSVPTDIYHVDPPLAEKLQRLEFDKRDTLEVRKEHCVHTEDISAFKLLICCGLQPWECYWKGLRLKRHAPVNTTGNVGGLVDSVYHQNVNEVQNGRDPSSSSSSLVRRSLYDTTEKIAPKIFPIHHNATDVESDPISSASASPSLSSSLSPEKRDDGGQEKKAHCAGIMHGMKAGICCVFKPESCAIPDDDGNGEGFPTLKFIRRNLFSSKKTKDIDSPKSMSIGNLNNSTAAAAAGTQHGTISSRSASALRARCQSPEISEAKEVMCCIVMFWECSFMKASRLKARAEQAKVNTLEEVDTTKNIDSPESKSIDHLNNTPELQNGITPSSSSSSSPTLQLESKEALEALKRHCMEDEISDTKMVICCWLKPSLCQKMKSPIHHKDDDDNNNNTTTELVITGTPSHLDGTIFSRLNGTIFSHLDVTELQDRVLSEAFDVLEKKEDGVLEKRTEHNPIKEILCAIFGNKQC